MAEIIGYVLLGTSLLFSLIFKKAVVCAPLKDAVKMEEVDEEACADESSQVAEGVSPECRRSSSEELR